MQRNSGKFSPAKVSGYTVFIGLHAISPGPSLVKIGLVPRLGPVI